MRRLLVLILCLLATPAWAVTTLPGGVGTFEEYGIGWDADRGFATKGDVYEKLEESVGTGVGLDELPDLTVMGTVASGSWTIVPGANTNETLTIGGVNPTTGLVNGSRIVFTSYDTPTLTLYTPVITSPAIAGGSINSTTIGGDSQAAGAFTTVIATGGFFGSGASITGVPGSSVVFADTDGLWTATNVQAALEEMNNSINAGVPNGTGAKVHWSQLLGMPADFADGADAGAGGGSGTMTTVKEDGSQVGGADIVTLDFLGADFDVSESPDTEGNIVIAAAITRDAEWDSLAEFFGNVGDEAAGIATWMTTPSSANLRSATTDETGTGALVFATAPTFGSMTITGTSVFKRWNTSEIDADASYLGVYDVDDELTVDVLTMTPGNSPTADLWTSTTIGGASIYRSGGTDVPVADGGTGASTLTGILQGNGTSAVTAITNSTTVGQTFRVTGSNTYGWGALDLADSDAVTGDLPFANLAQGSALSVLGVTGNSTADVASIAAGTDNQVLRRSGTAVAFGAVNLASSDAVTGTLPAGNLPSASTSASGIAEAAIASEVTTGTDASRYVSPDALAGSVYGTKIIELIVFDFTTDVATGDGKFYFNVPASLDGFELVTAHARVITAGTTGDTTVQVARVRSGTPADMLGSDPLDINSTETGSQDGDPGTVDTANDDLTTYDLIRIDVDAVSSVAPKGLIVTLEVRKP
jgi:hypothetical protein